MKQLFTSILLLFLTTSLFAQNKTLEKVDDKLFFFTAYTDEGDKKQTGHYKLINGSYEEHGYWKDHEHGTLAFFENGKMKWIKPKGFKKYTYKEIELARLKFEVNRLKLLVAQLEKP